MQDLSRLLDQIPALPVVTQSETLGGGSVNDTWLLHTDTDRFVLRADTQVATVLGLDRQRELDAVAAALNGPEVVWADPQQGLLLTRYIPGDVWLETDFARPDNAERLANTLSEMHTIRFEGPQINYAGMADHYARHIASPLAEQLADEVRRFADLWCADEARYVLCHHDLLAGNVVDPGSGRRPKFIDWEYAGNGELCVDLAAVLSQACFTPAAESEFLRAYGGTVEPERLAGCRALYARLAALWLMVVCAETNAPAAYKLSLAAGLEALELTKA